MKDLAIHELQLAAAAGPELDDAVALLRGYDHERVPEDPQLPEKVDVVLMVDTFHHITHRAAYFENLRRHVATDARMAIIDFKSDSPIGPPAEHRPSVEEIEADLKKAGWEKAAQLDFLPYQHFLIFTPMRQLRSAVTVEAPR